MEELWKKIEELEEENSKMKSKLEVIEKARCPLNPLPICKDEKHESADGEYGHNKENFESQENGYRESGASSRGSPLPLQTNDEKEHLLFYLKTILGYSIKFEGNTVILRSVYSFCNEDVFEIEIQGKKLILKHTDYLEEWNEYFNTYVVTGKSYCAFFAAITLNLFNRNTFG